MAGPGSVPLTTNTGLGTPSGAIVVFVISKWYCQFSSAFDQELARVETNIAGHASIWEVIVIIRANAPSIFPAPSRERAIGARSIGSAGRGSF